MSLLAKHLADQDYEGSTTPGTDYGLYQDLALGSGFKINLIPAISFTLKNVLPMPSENVTLEQILEFRENNRTELLRFRNLIAEFQIALAVSTTNRELQQNITVFEENIEENVGELEEILEE